MQISCSNETIDFPRAQWVDETGKVWDNPTLSFMEKRGWIEIIQPPMTPEEAYAASIPFAVTMRQARVALRRAGLLDSVTALVNSIGPEAVDTWEYSQEVQRSNPLVAVVATQAGWTTAQLDQLFIDASII